MDKPELFQIGTVAKLFHLSVSSLRHYEDIGLLKPEYVSPESGYRYYSARSSRCSAPSGICARSTCRCRRSPTF